MSKNPHAFLQAAAASTAPSLTDIFPRVPGNTMPPPAPDTGMTLEKIHDMAMRSYKKEQRGKRHAVRREEIGKLRKKKNEEALAVKLQSILPFQNYRDVTEVLYTGQRQGLNVKRIIELREKGGQQRNGWDMLMDQNTTNLDILRVFGKYSDACDEKNPVTNRTPLEAAQRLISNANGARALQSMISAKIARKLDEEAYKRRMDDKDKDERKRLGLAPR